MPVPSESWSRSLVTCGLCALASGGLMAMAQAGVAGVPYVAVLLFPAIAAVAGLCSNVRHRWIVLGIVMPILFSLVWKDGLHGWRMQSAGRLLVQMGGGVGSHLLVASWAGRAVRRRSVRWRGEQVLAEGAEAEAPALWTRVGALCLGAVVSATVMLLDPRARYFDGDEIRPDRVYNHLAVGFLNSWPGWAGLFLMPMVMGALLRVSASWIVGGIVAPCVLGCLMDPSEYFDFMVISPAIVVAAAGAVSGRWLRRRSSNRMHPNEEGLAKE